MSEKIRVLRVLEYVGDRKEVEALIQRSIQGERIVSEPGIRSTHGCIIRAATIGTYPEILETEHKYEY